MMETSSNTQKAHPGTILIVDDDELNCDILANIFINDHSIVTAGNGKAGLDVMAREGQAICAILLDVIMPIMDGLTMLEHMVKKDLIHKIPVFLITGQMGGDVIKRAYDLGVMDVISKPISPYIVKRRVESVIELFTKRNHFEELVAQQTIELREQNALLAEMNMGMIEALATATEFRSNESGEHVLRIHDITHLFLTRSPLHNMFSETEINNIAVASILHDVGKISVPDAILNKPGKFTPEEFEIMKAHTVNGDTMLMQIPKLKKLPFYDHARTIARHHHERWDGKGYPDHLVGDDIPLTAQIVSIADVYDALVSPRVYKPPFSHDETVKMIREGQCGQFNPMLLEYFNGIAPIIENLYTQNGANAHTVI